MFIFTFNIFALSHVPRIEGPLKYVVHKQRKKKVTVKVKVAVKYQFKKVDNIFLFML